MRGEPLDSYFALAAFVLGVTQIASLALIVVALQKCEQYKALTAVLNAEIRRLGALIRPFDPDADGKPGGSRKRHDPYVER